MTASSAADLASGFTAAITAQELDASQLPYGKALINMHVWQALNDGQPWTGTAPPPEPTDAKLVRELKYIAMDVAIKRLWQRNRIVYDIDPDLWTELGHTDMDTQIPEGLFAKLPHPDPFIALPTPLILPLDKNHQQRVSGFFVVGRGTGRSEAQVSTHSPAAIGNTGLLIGGQVETLGGKPLMAKMPTGPTQDMVWNRVTLLRRARTLRELIEEIRVRFDGVSEAGGFDGGVVTSIVACVSALTYLCSVNAELRPLPSSVNRRQIKGSGKRQSKPPKVIAVGYQVGAALRAYRRSERQAIAASSGRTMRPHVRRAHFHTYRVGAGRTDSIVKWLSPIPINMTTDAKKTTVVKVN